MGSTVQCTMYLCLQYAQLEYLEQYLWTFELYISLGCANDRTAFAGERKNCREKILEKILETGKVGKRTMATSKSFGAMQIVDNNNDDDDYNI